MKHQPINRHPATLSETVPDNPWTAFITNHFRPDEIAREQDQLASRIEAYGRAIKADIRAALAAVDPRKGE